MDLLGRKSQKNTKKIIRQEDASSWDVVVLSFKLLIQRIQHWIQVNFWDVLFSAGLVTAPAAKAGMHYAVAAMLRDPGGSEVLILPPMKTGFKQYFWKSLLISVVKWVVFALIAVSIDFWIRQESWGFRFVSVVSIYGLVLWWLSVGYLHPIMVENPTYRAPLIFKEAVILAFKKPFQSLLFAVVSSLLLIFGVALLGPVMLLIPVLRTILMMQGYWFITGREIPGFMEIYEYIQKREQNRNLR